MTQQINTLTILIPEVLYNGGTYAIEDIYTSYLSEYDDGYLKSSTLVESLKDLIGDIQSKQFLSQRLISLVLNKETHSLVNKSSLFDSETVQTKKKTLSG